jgi:hypothetical protein
MSTLISIYLPYPYFFKKFFWKLNLQLFWNFHRIIVIGYLNSIYSATYQVMIEELYFLFWFYLLLNFFHYFNFQKCYYFYYYLDHFPKEMEVLSKSTILFHFCFEILKYYKIQLLTKEQILVFHIFHPALQLGMYLTYTYLNAYHKIFSF